jgi:membrane-associated phospholipid phosphatase
MASLVERRGLIGFPSFYAADGFLGGWFARKIKWAFYPLLAFNGMMLLACPIDGGHHLVDLIGGGGVAAAAIFAAGLIADSLAHPTVGGAPEASKQQCHRQCADSQVNAK